MRDKSRVRGSSRVVNGERVHIAAGLHLLTLEHLRISTHGRCTAGRFNCFYGPYENFIRVPDWASPLALPVLELGEIWSSRQSSSPSGASFDATAARFLYEKPVQFRKPTFDKMPLYPYPYLRRSPHLRRSQDNGTVSFSTSFVIEFADGSWYRPGSNLSARSDISFQGAAFIIAPDAYTVGAGGGNLGLADPSRSMSHTVAVELDMLKNPEFGDPDGVHIGINVGNMTSLSVSTVSGDVYNRSHPWNLVQVWIEYHNPTQSLEIRINRFGASRPVQATLVREIDLSKIVLDDMYVGFSAALSSCKEDYTNSTNHTCSRSVRLLRFRFETFDEHSMASPVTDLPVGLLPDVLPGGSILRVVTVASVVAALAFLAGLGLFFYFRWDERRRWRFDVDADVEAGPRKFSYTKGFSPK